MALEQQIQTYREISLKIGELEKQKKELGLAIQQQMTDKVLQVPGYTVRRYERLNLSTSLEEARRWEATKMEEVVDKEKLKELLGKGEAIPGITMTAFIQVKKLERDADEQEAP